jgi:hypothetical protein
MNEEEINSTQYFEDVLQDRTIKEIFFAQQSKLINSVIMGFKTIFYGKKWIIYVAFSLLNLIIIMLLEGPQAKFEDPTESFINVMFGWLFPSIFIFGCLILSLPLSNDEISDHTIDLFLVRPIKREVYWLSRWIVVNIVIYCVNIAIYFVYFLYFHAFASKGAFTSLGSDFYIFGRIAILLIPATLIYAGLFLFIGMIGNRGLLIGLLIAIFDVFIVGLFLLEENLYIPQSNLNRIAKNLLNKYIEIETPEDLTLEDAWLYSYLFSIIVFACGAYYLRIREIK